MNCSRCGFETPTVFRVTSDVLNMLVCLKCALAALRQGLKVERVEDENDTSRSR